MTGSYGEELLRAALAGTDPDASPSPTPRSSPAQARFADWPQWLDPAIVAAFAELGLHRPWRHQIDAAEHAHSGRHVVVATGTASGKSLAYQLPVLQTLLDDHNATALYLAPTKALGVDQLRSFTAILATNADFARLAPCTYDGDTDAQLRQWRAPIRAWCSPTPTCCTSGSSPDTTGGSSSCASYASSSSTSATTTAACSARTPHSCCDGSCASREPWAPTPSSSRQVRPPPNPPRR